MSLVSVNCSKNRSYSAHHNLPYKVARACDKDIVVAEKRFNLIGVKVITIGQNYLISIPADNLFAQYSPRLRWGSYGLLNDVACYLKQFRKVAVNVTAFSSKHISKQRDKALTLARARAVGNYLETQDIDSRFIFTEGLGSDKPIVAMKGGGDSSPNSRIEITFRRQVA